MAYEFRLEPDDGRAPLTLEYDTYHDLFPALSRADISLFQPLKRFRGAHAFVVVEPHQLGTAKQELHRIQALATNPDGKEFLQRLDRLFDAAAKSGCGVRGGQPYPWDAQVSSPPA